jgi:UDP-2,3-diacylglucosamine pyrophosphatase LpxH
MKILISDLHFGVKKANEIFLDSQLKFIREQLIPEAKAKKIKDIYILGDILDTRQTVNIKVFNILHDLFEIDLAEFNVIILLGNHDIYYNSTIDVHSLKFLSKFPNVQIIDKITEIGKDLFVPWLVEDKPFIEHLEFCGKKYNNCFGHFHLFGFAMNKDVVTEDGLTLDIFVDKFKNVFTGHFHSRSIKEIASTNIVYIGSPYQITRGDINEPRGYTILKNDNTFEFVENKVSMQFKILNFPEEFTEETIRNNFVDVNVKYDGEVDEEKVQEYIKKIEEYKPAFPPVLKINNEILGDDLIDGMDFSKINSSEDLIREYINIQTIDNKENVLKKLLELYNRANKGE